MQMMILATGLLSVFGLLSAPESFASTIVFLDIDGLVSFVNNLQPDLMNSGDPLKLRAVKLPVSSCKWRKDSTPGRNHRVATVIS